MGNTESFGYLPKPKPVPSECLAFAPVSKVGSLSWHFVYLLNIELQGNNFHFPPLFYKGYLLRILGTL